MGFVDQKGERALYVESRRKRHHRL
jgi:hypothetical protein